ncbi:helix-turn-helix transcriptional regulator [Pseudenhygromyxa sp. WMMC2535]|uniref:helix-turn-helix domain-containing protein n=1 Tax=Pseudenhygromyxa sp. WMMC2535 TaxID=2712867 RepID=UPI00155302BB|nr:helix-turn-helix transcriptional regulator [Pseudenhygromyxa sp. WMMC2535]NVB40315.1 helix-turn-helix transcriptional regulator [Pseudenhygromyxa sp. WMMC2535]NVB43501.1 helix-turn-helix transcriptional regulator [Pseudenhygromyxa sp. WMMC2535]
MDMTQFAERVRLLRSRRELSQEELARMAGLSVDTISRIERARYHPTLGTMVKIAKAFGLSLVGLLEDQLERSDELAVLIRGLSTRDQHVALTLVGALRVRQTLDS